MGAERLGHVDGIAVENQAWLRWEDICLTAGEGVASRPAFDFAFFASLNYFFCKQRWYPVFDIGEVRDLESMLEKFISRSEAK